MQVDKPFPMDGRNGHWFAKAEAPGFSKTAGTGPPLAFVGQHDDMRPAAANLVGKEFVCRGDADTGINHQKGDIRLGDGTFGLAAHAVFQRSAGGFFKASRINDPKAQFSETGIPFPAVTRDAGLVIDNRVLASDKPVEQRRFTNIRTTHNGKRCFHRKHTAF
ncbi:MAG: Uncharacterised protein [SAR116 cluster bacterium]|nr:MAG: Uncharacterised protein [SAR116 cluster bacterium]